MYYYEEENRKKRISYKKYRKSQIWSACAICVAGFIVAILFLPIFFFLAYYSFSDFIQAIGGNFAMALMTLVMICAALAYIVILLTPLVIGIIRITGVMRNYKIVEDELEYIKPFEASYHTRRGSKRIDLHGYYFKEHGRLLSTVHPDKVPENKKYYLEICGKKAKIIDMYSCETHELVE